MRVIRERGNVTCWEILNILRVLGQKKRSLRDNMAKGSKNTKGCGKRRPLKFSLMRNGRAWDVIGSTGPNKIHIRH